MVIIPGGFINTQWSPVRGSTADSPLTDETTWQEDIYDLQLPVPSLLSKPETTVDAPFKGQLKL